MQISSLLRILTFIIIILTNQNLKAENKYSYGIGSGTAAYGGLGFNIGIVSSDDVKYLSCGGLYDAELGFNYSFGIGWLRTDILETTSKKHGLGIFVGIIDHEIDGEKLLNSTYSNAQNVYGGGFTYQYYYNGIQNPGAKIGISILFGNYEDDDKLTTSSFEIGYQF